MLDDQLGMVLLKMQPFSGMLKKRNIAKLALSYDIDIARRYESCHVPSGLIDAHGRRNLLLGLQKRNKTLPRGAVPVGEPIRRPVWIWINESGREWIGID